MKEKEKQKIVNIMLDLIKHNISIIDAVRVVEEMVDD